MSNTQDIYPSRIGEEEKIIQRLDPVVYGDCESAGEGALDRDQLKSYEENGYLLLPDYMPEMVDPLLEEIDRMRDGMQGKEELYTEPDSNELRTIFKPFAFSQTIERFSRHPRILRIVQQLLGSDAYVMQSRINIKPPFRGKSFPWHSDFETWHVEDGMPRMRALTAWIMLTENNEHNGPLYVIPGSHKEYVSCRGITEERNFETSLKKQVAGVPTPQSIERLLRGREIQSVYGKPGSVVFHECNIMHGSPDNISATPRTILMFVYNSTLNKPVAPFGGQAPRPHYLSNRDHTALVCAD